MRGILLLTVSNLFMTIAWWGQLRFREKPLFLAIVVSWLIAFFEHCFQVPANRIGFYQFATAQLKTIQGVITLVVFCLFSIVYLKELLRWNYLVGVRVSAGGGVLRVQEMAAGRISGAALAIPGAEC
jgi:hypothetical protein